MQIKSIFKTGRLSAVGSATLILWISITFNSVMLFGQIDNNGCIGGNFGIDAGLYSGIIEYGDGSPAAGTTDWFLGTSGRGTIDESNTAALTTLLMGGGNPTYENRMSNSLSSIVGGQILIDGLFARDYFGGSGYIDTTTFETSSKNGDDPAIWDAGQGNVLGKNDIIDVAGHMFRDGTSLTNDLWFVGLISRAEPGGSAYIDFEFFVEDVVFNANPQPGDAGEGNFTSGGPNLGHTGFTFNQTTGEITGIGDFIFNISLINGGIEADVEMRLWVSRSDYDNVTPVNFTWGPEYDGPFTGSPFGYASIIPSNANDACGYVNLANENPLAPPWGTLNTKDNLYQTAYNDFSIAEVGVNMTAFGVDHASLVGADLCAFPLNTFMAKTRSSASFRASLKDYSGPFVWGVPYIAGAIVGPSLIACDNPTVTMEAQTERMDVTFLWTTIDGNIISDPTAKTILVDLPGTYTLTATLPTGCDMEPWMVTIGFDPAKPFFNELTATTVVSCNGNDGSIDITVDGGTSPYTFDWDYDGYEEPDDDAEDPTGLAPGIHTVVITDATGCIDTAMVTVDVRVVALLVSAETHVDCHGEMTGAIDMTVTGQTPFTYEWSTGAVTEDISNLAAGTYTLVTTDGNACTDTLEVTITESTAIVLSASTTDVTATGADDGEADLTVSGGTPPYTYDWDNDGLENPDDDTEDLTGLPSGDYTVIMTDSLGCQDSLTVTIYEPEICDDGIDNDNDGVADCFDDDCIPPDPGPITPSDDPVCVGDVGVTYTIDPVAGATGYNWTVPSGATITAGQGTVSITVDWTGTNGGQICVTSDNVGCSSASSSCITVEPDDVPQTSGNISNQN